MSHYRVLELMLFSDSINTVEAIIKKPNISIQVKESFKKRIEKIVTAGISEQANRLALDGPIFLIETPLPADFSSDLL